MREVPALVEAHADNRIARLDKRHVRSKVGVSTRVRLHVGKTAAEQLASAFAGKVLDNIDLFTAAVIALAGQTFGIFIGQVAARRRHHRGGNEIFARYQLDIVPLAVEFLFHRLVHFGVGISYGR